MANPAAEARARLLAKFPEAIVVERGRYHIKHRLADGPDGRPRYVLDCWLPPIAGGAPDTVNKDMAASGDDGYRWAATGFSVVSSTPFVGHSGVNAYHNSYRWVGVTIEGTITTAYVQVYGHASAAGVPERRFYGVDEDNPAAPTTYGEFDADPLTTAYMDWDGAWTVDDWNTSPELKTIFQELVDSYTISDDAVMVQLKDDKGADTHYQACRHYDYEGNLHGPKLHIEYTTGAAAIASLRLLRGVGR